MQNVELRGVPAIAAAAGLITAVFTGSTLVTPLYPLYQQSFGFSETTLTLIYAVYVIGNVTALLFLARLSDQIGRRRVGLAAIVAAAAATALFLAAETTGWLFWARMLSGLAVGLGSGTGTAWLAELVSDRDRALATLIATCANFFGTAIGPFAAGLLAQYAPLPLQLSYIVYLVALLVAGVFVALSRETITVGARRMGDISLRPRLGLPRQSRSQFAAAAITTFATFALVGFYAALIPSILAERLSINNHAVGGAIVGELFLVSTLAMIVTRKVASRLAMVSGLTLLLAALALLVVAQLRGSVVILVIASAVAGIAAAFGYRGSLQIANETAPQDRRAEIVSAYYVCSFFGNSLPVIGVGILSALVGPVEASFVFAASIAVFDIVALLIGRRA